MNFVHDPEYNSSAHARESRDEISHRILEAEKMEKKVLDRPKRKWIKVRCPNCGYRIEFEPKPDWTGEMRCPECGHSFKITRLDSYFWRI